MKITIIYDNEVKQPGLTGDHGFSCLIELPDMPKILFDTGRSGSILLRNMKQLEINPRDIGIVVISHNHGDHTGGLQKITEVNADAEYYLPPSFTMGIAAAKVNRIKEPLEIRRGVFSTGELAATEQSLVLKTDKGIIVVTGCSHPGVGYILDTASGFGEVYGIIGGFHGFDDFDRLNHLSLICPCHCTRYKQEIKQQFQDRSLDYGAGMVIEL